MLRIFMRWPYEKMDFKEVGDPEETSNVKMKKIKNKMIREDLLNDESVQR